ncbi:hypothetical protein LOD99_1513 [Oopsacas minuta]|uniref:Uncharacterized protein n=1 Tax=Oopsacas minuta TaxID=111878 RepID=A0AAV7K5S5_9METZ|nr:hypothetical protein LOD99_1513 [Oopsacas minuta]
MQETLLVDPGSLSNQDSSYIAEGMTERSSLDTDLDLNDIGHLYKFRENDWFLDYPALSDLQKLNLLAKHRMPDLNFSFPFGEKLISSAPKGERKTQKVYLSFSHITGKFDCFKYSFLIKGVVCVPCALFTSREVENDKGKLTKVGSFVQTPFTKLQKDS